MTDFSNEATTPDPSNGGGADPAVTPAADPAPAADAPATPSFDRSTLNGSYKDWASSLDDEGKRDMAGRFKDFDDLIDVTVKQRKEMSTRIKLPGKDATAEDLAAFNRAIGVPGKAEEYEVKAPEGYELSPNTATILDQFKAKALEAGVRKSEFGALAETYLAMEKAAFEAEAAELAEGKRAGEAELKKQYGKDLEVHLNAGRDLLHKLEIPGMEDFLGVSVNYGQHKIPLGDHPTFIAAMAKLGLRGGEAQPGGLNLAITKTDRENAKARIDEIYRTNPPGSEGYKSPKVQQELNSLFEMMD